MSGVNSLEMNQLKSLIEINERINSNYSDTNALLSSILEGAMHLVFCEASSLFIVNPDNKTLRMVATLDSKGFELKNVPVAQDSIASRVVEENSSILVKDCSADSSFAISSQNKNGLIVRSILAVPMYAKEHCIGVVELFNKTDAKSFDSDDLNVIEMLSAQASIAYANADAYRTVKNQVSVLSSRLSNGIHYHSFVAQSPEILDILKIVHEVARTNTTILITGENGTGKELVAEQIHLNSARSQGPFVRVNCSSFSDSVLENELFGSASAGKGAFESAGGGTLFLDEIGGLSLEMQSRLLKVLQERKIEKGGSGLTVPVDIRLVAATGCDLEQLVNEGKFRSDLYYRLNVLPVNVPPLRARKDDIEPLARFFLEKYSAETKKNYEGFSNSALNCLYDYYWPGNVRELENVIERACIYGKTPLIQAENLGLPSKAETSEIAGSDFKTMAEEVYDGEDKTLKTALNKFKAAYITKILQENGWNQTVAGKILGIQRTYVNRLLNELNIR